MFWMEKIIIERGNNLSLEKLKQKIKSKDFAGLFYLYGEEEHLKEHYYLNLKKKSVSQMREFNVQEFVGENLSLNALENAINSFPMMSEMKFVGIVDLDHALLKEDYKKELSRILSDIPSYVCVVFWDTALKGEKDSVLQRLVTKAGGLAVDVVRPGPAQLVAWGRRQFKSAGREISNEDMYYILDLAENDMLSLQNEIKKIAAFAQNDTVTRSDIDAVITKSLETNRFALGEALTKRDFSTALRVVNDLYAQQYDEIQVANLIYRCLVDLLRASWTIRACRRNVDMKADFGIHEYGAAKMMNACKAMSEKQLIYCVDLCLEYEIRLKSESGDKREMIYQLLCKIMTSGVKRENIY